jgi:hypothetical protein
MSVSAEVIFSILIPWIGEMTTRANFINIWHSVNDVVLPVRMHLFWKASKYCAPTHAHTFRLRKTRRATMNDDIELLRQRVAEQAAQIVAKDRQLAAKDRQLAAKDRQLLAKDARIRQLQDNIRRTVDNITTTNHTQRMALITMLDEKMDRLIDLHGQIVVRMERVENCLTTPPAGKRHGFALIKVPKEDPGKYQLFFYAGQENYVRSKIAGVAADDIIFAFTENGNPIDLRNNFKRVANSYLRDNSEVREVASLPDLFQRFHALFSRATSLVCKLLRSNPPGTPDHRLPRVQVALLCNCTNEFLREKEPKEVNWRLGKYQNFRTWAPFS